ncbi:MAG: serine/threonine-protein kinase [Kofleriaceae bacterium]
MRCLDANEVVRFLDGESGADAAAFEDHVDRCGDCRTLVTELGRALDVVEASDGDDALQSGAELVEHGTQVGRYVVQEMLGAGAMGVVYRAYDPELDRDVALKLVRVLGEGVERARGRLLREAQAMARLSHPNVVSVFDASTFGSHVYVAMELVEGVDLEHWLRTPRSWHAIAGVFADAGRGLAAAHRAGIIHRDFKPSNVLVGSDGRVCVTDFGLSAIDAEATGGPVDPDSRITAAGTVLGTPAYMSPEAAAGLTGDERSDQYSFAVALFEAVVGERPSKIEDARVPAPLRSLLHRGLSEAPADRFPSMAAMVDALVRARAPRLRRALPFAAVLVIGGAAFGGYRLADEPAAITCEVPAGKLAGVWDAPRKTQIHAAFVATNRPDAEAMWQRAEVALDDFATTFERDHVEACEAVHVRHEQSGELLDLRMACMQTELARFAAVTTMFAAADADVVKRAISASELAPRLAPCRDVIRLRDRTLSSNPATRTRIELATAELARIEVASARGKYPEAIAGAKRIAEEAVQLGDARLEAAALVSLGESVWRSGDIPGAEQVLHRGIDAAKRGRAQDLEAGALLTLVAVLGWEDARYDEALRIARLAESTIAAIGDDERLGKLLGNRAAIYYARGMYADARKDYTRALELLEKTLGPNDRRVGQAVMNLALIEAEPADKASLERALPLYDRALAIAEAKLGPKHPEVALTLANRAIAHANLEHYDAAIGDSERALKIRIEQLGPNHRDVAGTHRLLGEIEHQRGREQAALDHFRAALAIYEHTLRPDHPELAALYNSVGRTELALDHIDRAIPSLERALAIYTAQKLETASTAMTRFGLGRALWNRDRKRARELVALARKGYHDHPDSLRQLDDWVKAHP